MLFVVLYVHTMCAHTKTKIRIPQKTLYNSQTWSMMTCRILFPNITWSCPRIRNLLRIIPKKTCTNCKEETLRGHHCSLVGEFLPNFDMKNMISTYIMKKWPKFTKFSRKTFQIARILWWVSVGNQQYRRILSFFLNFHI
jgi:hypothetical protein